MQYDTFCLLVCVCVCVFISGYREDLIDKDIEVTVSRMQSVIELGRYIRDRAVIPIKVRICPSPFSSPSLILTLTLSLSFSLSLSLSPSILI